MGKSKIRMNVPYFQVPNSIFDTDIIVEEEKDGGKIIHREMRAAEKLVYIYLCRCANQGSRAFPSYADIAKKCGITRRTVISIMKVLEKNGFLWKTLRYKNTNVYELLQLGDLISPGCEKMKREKSHLGDLISPRGDLISPRKRTTEKELL